MKLRSYVSSIYFSLYRSNWTTLASFIEWIYCFLPSNDGRGKGHESIVNGLIRLDLKINILQQRKIYLLDEITALEELQFSKSLVVLESTEEEKENLTSSTLERYKTELSDLNRRLYFLKQFRWDVRQYLPEIPRITKVLVDIQNGKRWEATRKDCIARGGCCERGCGCCERPRQTSKDQENRATTALSHCTVACGCCIRERGFCSLSEEYMIKPDKLGVWQFKWTTNLQGLWYTSDYESEV